jgi:hypothetical protein
MLSAPRGQHHQRPSGWFDCWGPVLALLAQTIDRRVVGPCCVVLTHSTLRSWLCSDSMFLDCSWGSGLRFRPEVVER